ncbi:MAG: 4'-phosphopantetheinyl transferase superfamily protein [Eubacterium sp.]|nr:4'-phosphopantetheinyl transferase superfamily protein [Eubacterium sp.]
MGQTKDKNRIYAIDTDILKDEQLFSYYYALQRPERREKVDRMRFDKGKRLTLGAGIVMAAALEYAGVSGMSVTIDPHGKPVVVGAVCFFNISHTKNIAVCAVSDREVGIDVEHKRELKDPLIRRAFTPEEIAYAEKLNMNDKNPVKAGHEDQGGQFFGLSDDQPEKLGHEDRQSFGLSDDQLTYYTRLWTIKESVMKWYGLGLALPPEDIEVNPVTAGSFGMEGVTSEPSFIYGNSGADVAVSVKNHGDCDRLNFTFFSHKDCCITVCSEYENFTAGMEWIRIPGGQYGKN